MILSLFNKFGFPLFCDGEELPETDFDICTPNVKVSEIRRIFLSKVGGSKFDDWTLPGEWLIRVSETGTDIDAIRPLMVIGDKPTPNSIKKRISMDRNVTVLKLHTVVATIDDVSDTNHAFVEYIGSGKYFRMWYETMGGYMFGGNEGIVCLIEMDMVLPRGQGEIMTYNVLASWSSLKTEDRCISPIYEDVVAGPCDPVATLDASNITNEGFDVGWSGPLDAHYQYIITLSNTPPSSGYTTVAAGIGVSLTGLLSDTDYYVFVRVICADGGMSTFAALVVHTLASAPVLPVTSGLILFTDAGYGVQKNMGGQITQWDDLSGLNNHLLPTISPSWDVVPMALNGNDGVHMPGLGNLQTVGDLVGLTATGAFTIFWVTNFPMITYGQVLFMYGPIDDISINNGFSVNQQNPVGTAQNFIRVKGNIGTNQQIMNTTHDAVHLYSAVCNKANNNLTEIVLKRDKIINQVAGTGGMDNNNLPFGSYKFTVGSYGNGAAHAGGPDWANGFIGNIIIYNRALNATEVNDVTDYLMAKYGL